MNINLFRDELKKIYNKYPTFIDVLNNSDDNYIDCHSDVRRQQGSAKVGSGEALSHALLMAENYALLHEPWYH
jgi:hypothetical protein